MAENYGLGHWERAHGVHEGQRAQQAEGHRAHEGQRAQQAEGHRAHEGQRAQQDEGHGDHEGFEAHDANDQEQPNFSKDQMDIPNSEARVLEKTWRRVSEKRQTKVIRKREHKKEKSFQIYQTYKVKIHTQVMTYTFSSWPAGTSGFLTIGYLGEKPHINIQNSESTRQWYFSVNSIFQLPDSSCSFYFGESSLAKSVCISNNSMNEISHSQLKKKSYSETREVISRKKSVKKPRPEISKNSDSGDRNRTSSEIFTVRKNLDSTSLTVNTESLSNSSEKLKNFAILLHKENSRHTTSPKSTETNLQPNNLQEDYTSPRTDSTNTLTFSNAEKVISPRTQVYGTSPTPRGVLSNSANNSASNSPRNHRRNSRKNSGNCYKNVGHLRSLDNSKYPENTPKSCELLKSVNIENGETSGLGVSFSQRSEASAFRIEIGKLIMMLKGLNYNPTGYPVVITNSSPPMQLKPSYHRSQHTPLISEHSSSERHSDQQDEDVEEFNWDTSSPLISRQSHPSQTNPILSHSQKSTQPNSQSKHRPALSNVQNITATTPSPISSLSSSLNSDVSYPYPSRKFLSSSSLDTDPEIYRTLTKKTSLQFRKEKALFTSD